MAADDDLVAVAQRAPLDPPAVDVDAVQATGRRARVRRRPGTRSAHDGGTRWRRRSARRRPASARCGSTRGTRGPRCAGRSPRRRGTCRASRGRSAPPGPRPGARGVRGSALTGVTGRVPLRPRAACRSPRYGLALVDPCGCSLVARTRAGPATPTSTEDCTESVNGRGVGRGFGQAIDVPRRRTPPNHAARIAPARRARGPPQAGDRAAPPQRRRLRRRPAPLRALPSHAAHRRDRPRLRARRAARSGSCATCAARSGGSRRSGPGRCPPRCTSRSVKVSRARGLAASSSTLRPAVDPVTVSVTIDRPREEVFAYLSDIANHPEFSDHYRKDWRLLREDSVGRGAGARFKRHARFDRFGYYDINLAELDPPYRIIGVGRGGKYNRIETFEQWTLEPAARRRHPPRVHVRDRAAAPHGPPRRGDERPARVGPAQRRARPLRRLRFDPRGEPRPRRARDRRRTRLTRRGPARPACRSCASSPWSRSSPRAAATRRRSGRSARRRGRTSTSTT